jgi:HK97 family phage major capsid protein
MRERRKAINDEVTGLLAKMDNGHDLTEAELHRSEELCGQAKSLDEQIAHADGEQQRMMDLAGGTQASKGAAPGGLASAFTRELHAKGMTPSGTKALLPSGSVSLPVDPVGSIVADPYGRQGLAALVAQGQLDNTDNYAYLRQSGREQNAAVVPVGAEKPTSKYELVRVTGDVVTLAHLSEAVPRQWLADVGNLQSFITNELGAGLQQALGDFLLHGAEDPATSGVLSTSGVGSQDYDTDVLTTARDAMTALQVNGEQPTGWCFHPRDWQRIEQQRDKQDRYLFGGQPQGRPGQQLFGLPVELDVNLDEGTGLLGDWNTVRVLSRQPVTVDWSEAGDLFTRNQMKFRAEARVGLAITRPGAISTVTLTSSSSSG